MYFGTRKYRFELARQLIRNGNIEYHGRNCVLLVEIAGPKDEKSHMILDLGKLDDGINEMLEDYDHKTIHYPFELLVSTMFRRLKINFPIIWRITLYENDDTYYEYQKFHIGDTMKVTRGYSFSAAHRTHNHDLTDKENEKLYGKCNRLHGHEYKLEVTITGEPDKRKRVLIDPDIMNVKVLETVSKYHNQVLNRVLDDNPMVPSDNATTENFIQALWNELEPKFNGKNYELCRLRLHETDRNYFDYYGR